MEDRARLEQAITALEAQRPLLGDTVVDTALGPLREKLAALQPSPNARRLQATILFADLSGFTAMSDTMDAEDVTDRMNAVWQCLDQVILDHSGTIDKHIGDAVMALWGVSQTQEDDPARAVRAALALQAALWVFRAEADIDIHLRIGINTGLVVYSAVGTTEEWTAMGDAVNLASRLEHAAPIDGTLIAHTTYQHVRGLFNITVLPPILVKGKPAPIPIYRVNYANPRTLALPRRGVEGLETHMIGRDAELSQLQHAMEQALAGHPLQAFTVVGEAGLGKSRLLYEYRAWIELRPPLVRLFCGRATPEMQRVPYALLRDLLAFRFQLHDSDPQSVAAARLVAGMTVMLGATVDTATATRHATVLAQVIGLVETPPAAEGIDPAHVQHQVLAALTALFQAVQPEAPMLITLEDIHWADEVSLALFRHIETQCNDLRIVLIYLTRPSFWSKIRPGEESPQDISASR